VKVTGSAIFQAVSETGQPVTGDAKRLQLEDTDGPSTRVHTRVTQLMNTFFPELRVSTPSDLLSLPHASHQPPHTDFGLTNAFAALASTGATVPCSVIATFNRASSLRVWPASHKFIHQAVNAPPKFPAKPVQVQRVNIPAWHFIVLRGDTIHAGDTADDINLRSHCFFDHPKIRRKRDRTQLLDSDVLEFIQE
jgi:hypothetical protein